MKKRFILLSWKILEAKYIYYKLNGEHEMALEDSQYDKMEREYDKLAKELGLEPTAANMVGFDENRPSCRAVIEKFRRLSIIKENGK